MEEHFFKKYSEIFKMKYSFDHLGKIISLITETLQEEDEQESN
jgi:hypothetical protein